MAEKMDQKQIGTTIEPGFYYHYKHWQDKNETVIMAYAYEVLGLGQPTESDYGTNRQVVYRPLYTDAPVYKECNGKKHQVFDLRPLKMFLEPVATGERVRFERITEPSTINALLEQRLKMYGIPINMAPGMVRFA